MRILLKWAIGDPNSKASSLRDIHLFKTLTISPLGRSRFIVRILSNLTTS